jgi:hypothetical protein
MRREGLKDGRKSKVEHAAIDFAGYCHNAHFGFGPSIIARLDSIIYMRRTPPFAVL